MQRSTINLLLMLIIIICSSFLSCQGWIPGETDSDVNACLQPSSGSFDFGFDATAHLEGSEIKRPLNTVILEPLFFSTLACAATSAEAHYHLNQLVDISMWRLILSLVQMSQPCDPLITMYCQGIQQYVAKHLARVSESPWSSLGADARQAAQKAWHMTYGRVRRMSKTLDQLADHPD
eukprot:scpid82492/ scgid35237/ 